LPIKDQGSVKKRIIIGNNVWIGAHCNILAGAKIDDGCVIGAGSIITKHIPKNSVVVGINKIIKKRG
jgi:acetyltransferase-like isoleucine patch superfamily enzyme